MIQDLLTQINSQRALLEGMGTSSGTLSTEEKLRLLRDLLGSRSPEDEMDEIVKVIDGDTIELKKWGRVRLTDIWAPEIENKYSGRTAEYLGPEMNAYAKMFLEGKKGKFRVSRSEQKDVYGRWLMEGQLEDGTPINENLKKAFEGIRAAVPTTIVPGQASRDVARGAGYKLLRGLLYPVSALIPDVYDRWGEQASRAEHFVANYLKKSGLTPDEADIAASVPGFITEQAGMIVPFAGLYSKARKAFGLAKGIEDLTLRSRALRTVGAAAATGGAFSAAARLNDGQSRFAHIAVGAAGAGAFEALALPLWNRAWKAELGKKVSERIVENIQARTGLPRSEVEKIVTKVRVGPDVRDPESARLVVEAEKMLKPEQAQTLAQSPTGLNARKVLEVEEKVHPPSAPTVHSENASPLPQGVMARFWFSTGEGQPVPFDVTREPAVIERFLQTYRSTLAEGSPLKVTHHQYRSVGDHDVLMKYIQARNQAGSQPKDLGAPKGTIAETGKMPEVGETVQIIEPDGSRSAAKVAEWMEEPTDKATTWTHPVPEGAAGPTQEVLNVVEKVPSGLSIEEKKRTEENILRLTKKKEEILRRLPAVESYPVGTKIKELPERQELNEIERQIKYHKALLKQQTVTTEMAVGPRRIVWNPSRLEEESYAQTGLRTMQVQHGIGPQEGAPPQKKPTLKTKPEKPPEPPMGYIYVEKGSGRRELVPINRVAQVVAAPKGLPRLRPGPHPNGMPRMGVLFLDKPEVHIEGFGQQGGRVQKMFGEVDPEMAYYRPVPFYLHDDRVQFSITPMEPVEVSTRYGYQWEHGPITSTTQEGEIISDVLEAARNRESLGVPSQNVVAGGLWTRAPKRGETVPFEREVKYGAGIVPKKLRGEPDLATGWRPKERPVQYELDEFGNIRLDAQGKPIVKMESLLQFAGRRMFKKTGYGEIQREVELLEDTPEFQEMIREFGGFGNFEGQARSIYSLVPEDIRELPIDFTLRPEMRTLENMQPEWAVLKQSARIMLDRGFDPGTRVSATIAKSVHAPNKGVPLGTLEELANIELGLPTPARLIDEAAWRGFAIRYKGAGVDLIAPDGKVSHYKDQLSALAKIESLPIARVPYKVEGELEARWSLGRSNFDTFADSSRFLPVKLQEVTLTKIATGERPLGEFRTDSEEMFDAAMRAILDRAPEKENVIKWMRAAEPREDWPGVRMIVWNEPAVKKIATDWAPDLEMLTPFTRQQFNPKEPGSHIISVIDRAPHGLDIFKGRDPKSAIMYSWMRQFNMRKEYMSGIAMQDEFGPYRVFSLEQKKAFKMEPC